MERIYQLIGEIIEGTQYIEWNLALMMRYQTILKQFEKTSTIPLKEFEQSQKKAEELAEEMQTMTLGEIIYLIRQMNTLNYQELGQLKEVLHNRNYIVHQYFKTIDIEQICNNQILWENEYQKLSKISQLIKAVNQILVRIINHQEEEYKSIS